MKTSLLPLRHPTPAAPAAAGLHALPLHFRSEAFAEDLFDAPEPRDLRAPNSGMALRLPLLGVALAATLDWLGR